MTSNWTWLPCAVARSCRPFVMAAMPALMLLVNPSAIQGSETIPSAVNAITLAEYTAQVKSKHPTATLARNREQVAQSQQRQARSLLWPRLEAAGSSSLASAETDEGTRFSESYQVGLETRYDLFRFGRDMALQRAATGRALAVGSEADAMRQGLALAAHEAYFGYQLAWEVLKVNEGRVTQSERHLEQAKLLVEAGRQAPYHLLNAQAEAASAKVQVLEARNGLRLARLRLEALAGNPLPPDIQLADGLDGEIALPITEEAIQAVLEESPEVRAAQAALDAARYQVQAADRERLPVLSATAGYGFEDPIGDPGWRPGWRAGLRLGLPLFSGGAIQATRAEAQAGLEAAQARLDLARLDLELELRGNHSRLVEAVERSTASVLLVQQAEELYRVADELFRAGATGSMEIVDAEQRLVSSRLALARALYDGRISYARLQAGIGKLD